MLTIITPTLNAAGTIRALLESVASQKQACRHLIVDGGSTDETYLIANEFSHTEWIDAPRSSIYEAQNLGLAYAEEGWVHFLGADDFLLPGALERFAEANLTARWVHALMQFTGSPEVRYANQQQSFLYHTSLFKQYGYYRPEDGLAADARFNARLKFYGEPCQKLDFAVASFTRRGR